MVRVIGSGMPDASQSGPFLGFVRAAGKVEVDTRADVFQEYSSPPVGGGFPSLQQEGMKCGGDQQKRGADREHPVPSVLKSDVPGRSRTAWLLSNASGFET